MCTPPFTPVWFCLRRNVFRGLQSAPLLDSGALYRHIYRGRYFSIVNQSHWVCALTAGWLFISVLISSARQTEAVVSYDGLVPITRSRQHYIREDYILIPLRIWKISIICPLLHDDLQKSSPDLCGVFNLTTCSLFPMRYVWSFCLIHISKPFVM